MTRKEALEYHKNQHLLKGVEIEIALEQIAGEDENKVLSKQKVPVKDGFLRGIKKEETREYKIKDLRENLKHKKKLEDDIIGVIDTMLMR